LYTYIKPMKNSEWRSGGYMNRGYGKSKHAERLIQHAIEVFDLVEIVPATRVERSINHRDLQPSPATRYSEAQSTGLYVDVTHGARAC